MIILFAAALFNESRLLDSDVVRHAFAHVVNRQRRDRGTSERFHFYTRLVGRRGGAVDLNDLVLVDINPDLTIFQRNGMTERYQIPCLLYTSDAADE